MRCEAKDAFCTASEPKTTKKAAQIAPKTVFESVTISGLPEAIELNNNEPSELSVPTVTPWEQKGAPSATLDPKITKKTARTAPKSRLLLRLLRLYCNPMLSIVGSLLRSEDTAFGVQNTHRIGSLKEQGVRSAK